MGSTSASSQTAGSPSDLQPIELLEGFLPIEDHGVIGDGATAALVGRDGGVSWLCVPRFDSPPLFASILDDRRGGVFRVAPEGLAASRQRYEEDSGVLITELEGRGGRLRVTDALGLRSGADLREDAPAARGELLRRVEAVGGPVAVDVEIRPRGDVEVEGEDRARRLLLREQEGRRLLLHSTASLDGLRSTVKVEPGQPLELSLRWSAEARIHEGASIGDRIAETIRVWRRWTGHISYEGPRPSLVRRSAITLKLLDHFENGAIVAAPTSSLPEAIGGPRNWDYRYSWIRDAAFSVYALRRIGLPHEASGFLAWVLDAVERHRGRPRVLYDLDGEPGPPETTDRGLRGYRSSSPVRWGNDAAGQIQHDVFGEILDCAYQWASVGGDIDRQLWDRLRPLIDGAATEWRTGDRGIWEVRSGDSPFTYSAAMCQVALDRGASLAEELGLPGEVERWRGTAEEIRQAVVEDSWDEDLGAIAAYLGGGALDASVLSLPMRRVIPPDHPRMIATCGAIAERLDAGGGLLHRYLPEDFLDGVPGEEGAFLLCSFWLVDNLAMQGELERAHDLFEALCDRASTLGLLPEQIDPSTGRFLGNFPQAFSHVGLISSGYTLARLAR